MTSPAHDRDIANALASLTPLRDELDLLFEMVNRFKDTHPLHPKLTELPTKLRSASARCRSLHRELSYARKQTSSPATPRRGSTSTAGSGGSYVPPQTRSVETQTAAAPSSSGASTPRAYTPRASTPPPFSPRSSTPPPRSSPRSATPPPYSQHRTSGTGSGTGSATSPPRTSSPSSPRRPLLMLTRWPESELTPREALSAREKAIKDDLDHPLRIFYVKAPSHCNAEMSASEVTAQRALKTLTTITMMLPSEKKARFVQKLFLAWVCLCVGSEERRSRKIKRCVQRRREFFTPGALKGGCRIHLERKPHEVTSLVPSNAPPRYLSPSDPYRGLGRDKDNHVMRGSSRAGDLMPGKLNSRLCHQMHMMSNPLVG